MERSVFGKPTLHLLNSQHRKLGQNEQNLCHVCLHQGGKTGPQKSSRPSLSLNGRSLTFTFCIILKLPIITFTPMSLYTKILKQKPQQPRKCRHLVAFYETKTRPSLLLMEEGISWWWERDKVLRYEWWKVSLLLRCLSWKVGESGGAWSTSFPCENQKSAKESLSVLRVKNVKTQPIEHCVVLLAFCYDWLLLGDWQNP